MPRCGPGADRRAGVPPTGASSTPAPQHLPRRRLSDKLEGHTDSHCWGPRLPLRADMWPRGSSWRRSPDGQRGALSGEGPQSCHESPLTEGVHQATRGSSQHSTCNVILFPSQGRTSQTLNAVPTPAHTTLYQPTNPDASLIRVGENRGLAHGSVRVGTLGLPGALAARGPASERSPRGSAPLSSRHGHFPWSVSCLHDRKSGPLFSVMARGQTRVSPQRLRKELGWAGSSLNHSFPVLI